MEVEKSQETAYLSFDKVATTKATHRQTKLIQPNNYPLLLSNPRISPRRPSLYQLFVVGQLFCILLLSALTAFAQEFPEAKGYVNDYAHVLSAENWSKITELCREVEEKTGAQIAVVTVKSVGEFALADYVNRLFEKWGLGKKGQDNGVMLFLAYNERKVRIEVGYGLEGILPDITTGRILDKYAIPEFRRGNYDAGILAATTALAGIIAEDAGVKIMGASSPRLERSRSRRNNGSGFSLLQLLILFLIFGGSRWLWPLLFASTMGGRRDKWHGGWGGGFGGGFGGGGFGGFGGGSSGGGGADRSF